jgi:hypothetical protein
MLADKWIEINIHLNGYSRSNKVIAETVKELVEDFKEKGWVKSWHFFREPQIRLRFFGEEENISKMESLMDEKLNKKESAEGDLYSCHMFGAHGERNKEYVGEADYWQDDWSLAMKLWEACSEFAMDLIAKGTSKPLDIHGERHIHVLLNELGLPHVYANTGTEMVIKYLRPIRPNE